MEGLMNSLLLLGIAAFNAFTAYMSWRALESTKTAQVDIAEVKKHTNAMKDALVVAAKKEGFEAGKDHEEVKGSKAKK